MSADEVQVRTLESEFSTFPKCFWPEPRCNSAPRRHRRTDSSKFNPIEHLVFPHVTRACSGVPLECIETAKLYIEKTETTTGLKVVVKIVNQVFEKGRKYAEEFKVRMRIKFDNILPKFNYTAVTALE